MSYTVLARKYRPQKFAELVGQEHVSKTLSSAIASQRVAHAFLFTGVRGVGKTTTARLLAKALNCAEGPTASPCDTCDACKEIAAGTDMDVLEIDGASNNSVEDVRRLQESIPYRPARDRFKIVIVDEVHMLSTGAFNALLKTLEEPPEHVKFVFATTESHKVPVTIRSRCQRYDFRLIPQQTITRRIQDVLRQEGVEADNGSITIIAREAAGSMRDALTLLDQVIALEGTSLEATQVAASLGVAARTSVFGALDALVARDPHAVLRAVSHTAERGADMLHFARQVLELLRDLVVLAVTEEDSALVDLVQEERQTAKQLVQRASELELQRMFTGMARLSEEVARTADPRIVLEMGLVRLATRPPLEEVSDLLAELDQLRAQLTGGTPPSNRPPPSEPSTGRGPPSQPSPANTAHPSKRSRSSAPTKTTRAEPKARAEGPTEPKDPPVSSPAPEPTPERGISASAPAQSEADGQQTGARKAEAPDAMPQWERVMQVLRERLPALAAVLEHGIPREVTPDRLTVEFPERSFFRQQAASQEAQRDLATSAGGVLGAVPEVRIVGTREPANQPTLAEVEAARRRELMESKRKQALEHPRVQEAMQIFGSGAEDLDVHVDDESSSDRLS